MTNDEEKRTFIENIILDDAVPTIFPDKVTGHTSFWYGRRLTDNARLLRIAVVAYMSRGVIIIMVRPCGFKHNYTHQYHTPIRYRFDKH